MRSGLSDRNLPGVQGIAKTHASLGAIPISRHESHPGCWRSRKVHSLDGSRAGVGEGVWGEAYVWLDGKVTNVILNGLVGNAETGGSKEAALR